MEKERISEHKYVLHRWGSFMAVYRVVQSPIRIACSAVSLNCFHLGSHIKTLSELLIAREWVKTDICKIHQIYLPHNWGYKTTYRNYLCNNNHFSWKIIYPGRWLLRYHSFIQHSNYIICSDSKTQAFFSECLSQPTFFEWPSNFQ